MLKHAARALSLSVFLVAGAALAQPDVSPAAAGELPAPTARAENAPVQPAVVATESNRTSERESGLAAKVEALEKKVEALEEANKASQAVAAKASKLKFSGYVQGRYEWHQEATNGATFDSKYVATASNTNRFLLRHAYLTAQYAGVNAEYFFQIDANTNDGLGVRDAYAALVDTWTPLAMKLSAGQFRYPFGYEALQSDADREMPERAPIEKFFFDGERDRGLRLQGGYGFFNFSVALVNGTLFDGKKNLSGSKDPAAPYPFGNKDPNDFKDWVGRFGVDFGYLVGGLSGYFGKGLFIAPPTATSLENPDSRFKVRLGADLQGYVKVPGVGDFALKGEVIYGKDMARAYRGIAANPCKSSATWGFILTAVQNVSNRVGVVVRVDHKDTLASSVASTCTVEKTAAEKDRVLTVGGGLLYHASPNLKATVTYQHPAELSGGTALDNDFAMAQLQARY